eukprot:1492319-Prymnesium_polylepis.1
MGHRCARYSGEESAACQPITATPRVSEQRGGCDAPGEQRVDVRAGHRGGEDNLADDNQHDQLVSLSHLSSREDIARWRLQSSYAAHNDHDYRHGGPPPETRHGPAVAQ